MKKVVIYPGRFQPMLPHHAEVYKKLQATFPDADVYIATSDKVDGGKSPFNFKEKAEIMAQLHDIPTDKILIAPQPYLIDSYKNFNKQDTMVIFAVGEKDTDRFPMKNIDDNTGLDMTVRGEPRPKYYQMINTLKQHPALPMEERGYIYVAPNIEGKGEVASASAFRQAFTSVGSEQGQREVFEKYLGTFNESIFALFKKKIIGDKMKEAIEELRDIEIGGTKHKIIVKVGKDKSYTLFIDGKKKGEYHSMGQAKKAIKEFQTNEAEEDEVKVGTMALFVQDQDGGDHEVEVQVEIKNGEPEIVANTLPGPEDMLYWNDADIQQQATDAMDGGDIKFDEDTNEELDRIKSLAGIEEADEDLDNDAVRELELYAENDSSLYQQSYTPIAKNLSKKFKKGNYDSELAKKLWKYHADRAAAQYGEDLLSGRKAGLIMFNPNTRRALASELEDSWHDEMKAGNFMESSEIDEGKEIDCPCCNGGKGKCSHGKEVCGTCKGTGKVEESTNSESVEEAVVSTTANALDAAILELKKLAGLNS